MDATTAPQPSAVQHVTIAAKARICLARFESCLAQAALIHARELSMIEDQLSRFSLWTGNIRVFGSSRQSLDHRLREAPEVLSVVLALLETLAYRTDICKSVLEEFVPQIHHNSNHLPPIGGQLQEAVDHVARQITLLHKLSNTIRKASKHSGNAKTVEKFVLKGDEGDDVGVWLFDVFRFHLADRLPAATDDMRRRLATTMVLRRKTILYRRSKYGDGSLTGTGGHDEPVVKVPTAAETRRPAHGSKRLKLSKTGSMVESKVSGATTLKPQNFQKAAAPSVISMSRTIAFTRHDALKFPPAPIWPVQAKYLDMRRQKVGNITTQSSSINAKPDTEDPEWKSAASAVGEITCPYCFYTLPAEDVMDEHKWRMHVKNDLDPYVCLFDHCETPHELYARSTDWIKHMKGHTLRWRCASKTHQHVSTTPQEYIQHLKSAHNSKLSDRHLQVMADRTARSIGPLFPACSLCGLDEVADGATMEEHIAGHLRDLALKSLPVHFDESNMANDMDHVGSFASAAGTRTTMQAERQLAESEDQPPVQPARSTIVLGNLYNSDDVQPRDTNTVDFKHGDADGDPMIIDSAPNPLSTQALHQLHAELPGENNDNNETSQLQDTLMQWTSQITEEADLHISGSSNAEVVHSSASKRSPDGSLSMKRKIRPTTTSEASAETRGTPPDKTVSIKDDELEPLATEIQSRMGSEEMNTHHKVNEQEDLGQNPDFDDTEPVSNLIQKLPLVVMADAPSSDGLSSPTNEDAVRCVCSEQDYPGTPSFEPNGKNSLKDRIEFRRHFGEISEEAAGFFIQCDGCLQWQHGACFGFADEETVPDEFFCNTCRVDLHRVYESTQGQKYSIYSAPGRVSSRPAPPLQASSHWSVLEANEFPDLLKQFGSDWQGIAEHMKTKTAAMVKNYYVRQKGNNNGWEDLMAMADTQKALANAGVQSTLPSAGDPPQMPGGSTGNPRKGAFVCAECDQSFDQQHDFHRHSLSIHGRLTFPGKYTCFVAGCAMAFHSKEGLKQHCNNKHGELGLGPEDKFAIPSAPTKRRESEWEYMNLKSQTEDDQQPPGPLSAQEEVQHATTSSHLDVYKFACDMCDQKFDQIHKLNHHRRYHDRPYACPYEGCDKKFGTRTHRDRHINDKHRKSAGFHCTEPGCDYFQGGKSFPRKDNWRRHMINKHGIDQQTLDARLASMELPVMPEATPTIQVDQILEPGAVNPSPETLESEEGGNRELVDEHLSPSSQSQQAHDEELESASWNYFVNEKAVAEARKTLDAFKRNAADEALVKAEEAHQKELDAFKRNAANEALVKAEEADKQARVKDVPPIKFKDAVGRKFNFPFHLCQRWTGMEELIKQAFLHVDGIHDQVHQGRFDLVGPDEEIILPAVWDKVIEPGWAITMHMWPMDLRPSSSHQSSLVNADGPPPDGHSENGLSAPTRSDISTDRHDSTD